MWWSLAVLGIGAVGIVIYWLILFTQEIRRKEHEKTEDEIESLAGAGHARRARRVHR